MDQRKILPLSPLGEQNVKPQWAGTLTLNSRDLSIDATIIHRAPYMVSNGRHTSQFAIVWSCLPAQT